MEGEEVRKCVKEFYGSQTHAEEPSVRGSRKVENWRYDTNDLKTRRMRREHLLVFGFKQHIYLSRAHCDDIAHH